MKGRKMYRKSVIFLMLTALLAAVGCGTEQKDLEETRREEEHAKVREEETMGAESVIEETSYVPVATVNIAASRSFYPKNEYVLVDAYGEFPSVALTLEGEQYPEIREAVENWSRAREEGFQETVNDYDIYAQEHLEMLLEEAEGENVVFHGYSTYCYLEYTRADRKVLSFCQMYSDYTGGAHGNYAYEGTTFDVATGKELELADLLQEETTQEMFCETAGSLIAGKLEEMHPEGLYSDYETVIRESLEQGGNWYLDASGITFIFNPYEIGPYAMGPSFVPLGQEELANMIKPEYLELSEEGMARLPEEELEAYELPEFTGSAGEENYFRIGNGYIIHKESGQEFLVFDVDMASDDYITYIYEMTENGLVKRDETTICSSINPAYMNPEMLELQVRVDALGTYSARVYYNLNEEGKLESEEGPWELENDVTWRTLTTTRELPVIFDGKNENLPAGSQICLTAVDLEGIVWFQETDGGREGEIHFTRGNDEASSWPIYIDGLEEFEYFEELPYAG